MPVLSPAVSMSALLSVAAVRLHVFRTEFGTILVLAMSSNRLMAMAAAMFAFRNQFASHSVAVTVMMSQFVFRNHFRSLLTAAARQYGFRSQF